MQFESRIAGIPCIINVTYYNIIKGEGCGAPSDIDARGGVESEFEVLDSRGRRALWLERKLNADMIYNIKSEIAELV
jgi:hypothetical protein